jgi:hypothetical protein
VPIRDDNFLSALKPLGLNCLLNKNCTSLQQNIKEMLSPATITLECMKEKEDPNNIHSQCLCLLGKEIGFSDDALESYVRLKEIHTFSPKARDC